MKILFIIDKLEFKYFEFNDLVTDFWFIKEFLKNNETIDVCTNTDLSVENAKGCARVCSSFLKNENIYKSNEKLKHEINDYDVVFFRSDPPVNSLYHSACSVFDFVDKEKTFVINNPHSLKNFNEKLHVNLFPDFVPKNIVSASTEQIHDFVMQHSQAVIKPLNECFGSNVYYLEKNDRNLLTIINNVTQNGSVHVMVQEFLKSQRGEDKRVLLIGNEVLDECILKLPQENAFKFSQHSDKFFDKTTLTDNERKIAQSVAQYLSKQGIYLTGLDMMNEKIIEINVTSPCYFIREINKNYGIKFEEKIISKLYTLINFHTKTRLQYANITG